MFLTGLFALLFYVATGILLAELFHKIREYWRAPAPLKSPTTPAPETRTGVAFRVGRALVFFESLLCGSRAFPARFVLFVHLLLILAFLFFSKLLHTAGVSLSPTRNQVDALRERRHLALWTAELESTGHG